MVENLHAFPCFLLDYFPMPGLQNVGKVDNKSIYF